jgi:hypothetical protein
MLHQVRTRLSNITGKLTGFRKASLAVVVIVTLILSYSAKTGGSAAAVTGQVKATILQVMAAQKGPWNVGIVGAPTVRIGNAPEVNASQRGSWTVGIAGTPTVNIGNSPTLALSPDTKVTVANPPTSPVLVRDTKQPFQGPCSSDPLQIPDDKLLVIEQVSVQCGLPPGHAGLREAQVCTDFANNGVSGNGTTCFAVAPVLIGSTGGLPSRFQHDFVAFSQEVRIYAKKQVTCSALEAFGGEPARCNFSYSGHLIDDLSTQ